MASVWCVKGGMHSIEDTCIRLSMSEAAVRLDCEAVQWVKRIMLIYYDNAIG